MKTLMLLALLALPCPALLGGELQIPCDTCGGDGKTGTPHKWAPCKLCNMTGRITTTEEGFRAWSLKDFIKRTEGQLATAKLNAKLAADRGDTKSETALKQRIAELESQLAAAQGGKKETPEQEVASAEADVRSAEALLAAARRKLEDARAKLPKRD